jgi:hypothetical protein
MEEADATWKAAWHGRAALVGEPVLNRIVDEFYRGDPNGVLGLPDDELQLMASRLHAP